MRISQTEVAVIGAGPAGLMAAETIAQGGGRVTVYDAMPSAGRKFLMAGRGGLNLTHSEPLPTFLSRYREASPQLAPAIEAFSPDRLRAWCEALGQPTFVGSSGRIFPKVLKASPLLRAWLRRLDAIGVQFSLRHRWSGWDEKGRLLFQMGEGQIAVETRATVLALGGASWPRLGSDGGWVETLRARGVKVFSLEPANCGFTVLWSDIFRKGFEGQPLKNITLSFGTRNVRGEAVITRAASRAARSMRFRPTCAKRSAARVRRPCTSPCGLIFRQQPLPRGCRHRAGSRRFRTGCARRRPCRRLRLGCCRKPQNRPGYRCRRYRRKLLQSRSTMCGCVSPAPLRSRARSRAPAALLSMNLRKIS